MTNRTPGEADTEIAALVALIDQERAADAEHGARARLEANPNVGMLWKVLGVALLRQGKDPMPALLRAAELMPHDAESHGNLAHALLRIRRNDEAIAYLRRAVALQPQSPTAHVNLGNALREHGRSADAEAACHAALNLDANCVEALCLSGELRADHGEFAAAEELFRQAIAVNPDYAPPFVHIAAQRRLTPDDTAWRRGAEALLTRRLPLEHEIGLRYALGKYCDDTGQYDEAFGHFRQANELSKRRAAPLDRAKLTQRVDAIMSGFEAASMRRCRSKSGSESQSGSGSGSELPVFIIGMPRSGTSLTEQILASHPSVYGAGELLFWHGAFAAYRRAELQTEGAGAALIPGMAEEYLARLTASSGGAARVVDKMPANFMYAGLIHAAFPNAKIIHVQRDPLDTCLSIYFQNFSRMGAYANDLDNLGFYYGEYLRITEHWRTALPATALLEMSYEELTTDPEAWTRRLLDFIGLPWDPKCLEFHQTDRVVITASQWQVRQKIHAASVGRWRHYEKYVGPLQHLLNHPALPHRAEV